MKILFYSDSIQTGGHEIMAVEAIKALSMQHEVSVIVSSFNANLYERLKKINNIRIYSINYHSNRFQIIRNFFSYRAKVKLKIFIQQLIPDLCISIQGTIDSGFLILPVCKKENIKTVSYIPIAHELKTASNHRLIGILKDKFQLYYYRVPEAFITITDILAERIIKKSNNSNVYVVKNGIDFSKYIKYNKEFCRKKYNMPEDKYVVGYIGRIELWHKGLDYYMDFLHQYADHYPNAIFLFVGKGNNNAELKLKNLASTKTNVRYFTWTDNVSEIYSLIDCCIQPSRFESGPGCPLTMIEALFFDIPIIASDIPEFSCFLPHNNLFEIKNYDRINNKIQAAINRNLDKAVFNHLDFSIEAFRENFTLCINEISKNR